MVRDPGNRQRLRRCRRSNEYLFPRLPGSRRAQNLGGRAAVENLERAELLGPLSARFPLATGRFSMLDRGSAGER